MSPSRWRVVHTFDPPIRLLSNNLPSITDIAFGVDDLKLHSLTHTISREDSPNRQEVIAASRKHFQGAITALRYLQGGQVHWWSHANRLEPPEGGLFLTARGTGTVGPRPIDLPGKGWASDLSTEVATWTILAAQAQESPSAAIRMHLYFLALEDMEQGGRLAASERHEYADLKVVRHFVSHPDLSNPKTLSRLEAVAPQLRGDDGTFAYDPHNPAHEATLNDFSNRARRLVDNVILTELGVRGDYWG